MSSQSSNEGTLRVISQSNRPALLKDVSSYSCQLVVAMIVTGLLYLSKSSMHEINYATILFSMSFTLDSHLPAIESISSMKSTEGAFSATSLNKSQTLLSDSPDKDDTISGPESL